MAVSDLHPNNPLAKLLREKRGEVLRLAEEHGASNVRVFGSVARNEATAGSDVDLLVKLQPGVTLFHLVSLTESLEQVLGASVDVVSETALDEESLTHITSEAKTL